jgi:surface protein
MSGTSEMMTTLANFNTRNTGTFYPELYRIKMLILNANKRSLNASTNTSYTTVSTDTYNTYLISILANLKTLFPDFRIYYNQTAGTSQTVTSSNEYGFGDFFQTTASNNTHNIYIYPPAATHPGVSGPALTTGTFTFSYIPLTISSLVITSAQAPFITTTGFTVSAVSSSTSGTAIITPTTGATSSVIVTFTMSYSLMPTTVNFGLSFTTAFKNWLSTNASTAAVNITAITNIPLSTVGNQFSQLASSSFTITPSQKPIIRPNTSLVSCFEGCTTFNSNISGWNTSNVTNMSRCFFGCSVFNNDTAALTWNTTRVTDMSSMFQNAIAFNQPITYNTASGFWNTLLVMTIASIFNGATIFNNGAASGAAGTKMGWILTGLSGSPGILTSGSVNSASGTSISSWKLNNSGLNANNAPAALTVSGAGTTFL